ncbi:PilZ domain-containing protein [Motilimonas pumila]|uniref:PilZ domain-containing protein n=1 Tax=Motilimonas pumila TaxID=2303987 RepID=A0A418YBX3_9GAMM|nr:PilZ domain-containing protein [Motilimonas pumila]RJG41997.1 PilZ domain-containing protein [Motilimonas pumila]
MQTDSYFSVQHAVDVNISPLAASATVPQPEDLLQHMPTSFHIASEIANIDAGSMRFLTKLGEQSQELLNYVQLQAKKIDLLLCHIIAQEDNAANRHQTYAFGGGGISIMHQESMTIGQPVQLKLFLLEEAAAVFCFGEIVSCKQQDQGYDIHIAFSSIREVDRELIVRASLHVQSKQLKLRAEQRNTESF